MLLLFLERQGRALESASLLISSLAQISGNCYLGTSNKLDPERMAGGAW